MANIFSALVLAFTVASFGFVVETWTSYVPAGRELASVHHLLW
jgi:hypothetical protein